MVDERKSNDLSNLKTRLAKAFVTAQKNKELAGALQTTVESKIKSKTKNLLLEGLFSGQLDAVIKRSHEVHAQEKTKNLLLEGLSTGQLESAIRHAKEENQKRKARNLLLEGLSNGSLDFAIKKSHEQHHLETFRNALVSSYDSGKLESLLTEVSKKRAEEKVRKVLEGALESGALDATLKQVWNKQNGEQVRHGTRNLLLSGLSSGNLEAAIKTAKLKNIQAKTRNFLMEGLKSGSLSDALNKTDIKKQALNSLLGGLASGKLESAIGQAITKKEADKGTQDMVKKQALSRLLDGMAAGKLETALQSAKSMRNPQPLQTCNVEQNILNAKAEPYRQKVAERLFASLRTGELRDAIRKVKNYDQEVQEKETVKAKLLQSLSSGKLMEAPTKAMPSQVAQPRERAFGVLMKGLNSGKLDGAIQEAKARAVCEKAKQSISVALNSGKLETALLRNEQVEDKATAEQKDELRQKALSHLLAGLRSTKMEATLQKDAGAEHKAQENSVEQAKEVSIEKIKQKALPALLDALKAGTLDKALAGVAPASPESRLDQLKAKLRKHMVSSTQDSTLSKALNQVSEEKVEKMRNSVCENLMDCLRAGKLESAFRKATKTTVPQDLRSKAHAALTAGLKNGRLEAAVSKEAIGRMDATQIRDRFRENLNALRYEVSHDWNEDRASLDLGGSRPMESYFQKFGHASVLAKATEPTTPPASSTLSVAEAASKIQMAWARHQDATAAATRAREKREAVSRCQTPTSQKPRECKLIQQRTSAKPSSQIDTPVAPMPTSSELVPVAPTSPKAPQGRKNPRRSRRTADSLEESPVPEAEAAVPEVPKVEELIPMPPTCKPPPTDGQRHSVLRGHRHRPTVKASAGNTFRMDSDTEQMPSKAKKCDLENEFEALSPKVEFFNMSSSKPPGSRRVLDPASFPMVGLTSPSKKVAPANFTAAQPDFSHWLPQATTPRSRPNALLPELTPSLTASQIQHTSKMFDSIARKTPRGGCF
eukprot:gnl/MRDRNA2_/MRDRNA2_170007_c0_seq1.p1 gnl/MRDRNA2_/MRDRNA2_170007_c0~~gnl/MRDRNA2_/MRDRNA2_170007_c0_seq1.p1  ORF type:complete len:1020 (-),score=257.59 gnl/MRDRNA2_/MRDRNA2_170007_c0_seq1:107-3097(-)